MLRPPRLVHEFTSRTYNAAGQLLMMSASNSQESVFLRGGVRSMSRQSVKDRRWNSSQGIVFQQSSQARRSNSTPAYISNTSEICAPDKYPERVGQLGAHQTSQEDPTETSSPNTELSDPPSYPDISFALSAVRRSNLPISISNSERALLSNGTSQLEMGEPVSTSQDDGANTSSVPDETFRGSRRFHIPSEKFQNALDARPGSTASYWQYTLYQGPEGDRDKVKLHYCKNKETTEAVSQLFIDEEVIGFDIEWSAQAKSTDGIKKNVALIQIACGERIALFHIARYPGTESAEDLVAPTLKRIMESPKITKAGVAIKGDCTRLKKFLGIECQGLFELSYLHKLVEYCSGNIDKVDRRYVRLAEQVQEHLKLPLLKGHVQTSDWGRDLDYEQTQYAASDSYAGFQLFHILEEKRQSFDPVPPRPAHAELNLAISLGEQLRPKQPEECLDDQDQASDSDSVSSSDLSVEELAREYFHVSLEDSSQVTSTFSKRPVKKPAPAQSPGSTSLPLTTSSSTTRPIEEAPKNVTSSPELELANQYASTFNPLSNRRIAPQALRAYSLWHKQGLAIPEVASILRQPPLQHGTVMSYLCDAITNGNLKSEPSRVLDFVSEYGFQPYIKSHRNLFLRAEKEVWRSQMIKAKRLSDEDGPN